jgi:predicted transcriptional regulator
MNQTLTIRITDELKKDLNKVSLSEEKPVSDIVRESIKMYVALRRFRMIRKKILPFAEAEGILTDEDVFRKLK